MSRKTESVSLAERSPVARSKLSMTANNHIIRTKNILRELKNSEEREVFERKMKKLFKSKSKRRFFHKGGDFVQGGGGVAMIENATAFSGMSMMQPAYAVDYQVGGDVSAAEIDKAVEELLMPFTHAVDECERHIIEARGLQLSGNTKEKIRKVYKRIKSLYRRICKEAATGNQAGGSTQAGSGPAMFGGYADFYQEQSGGAVGKPKHSTAYLTNEILKSAQFMNNIIATMNAMATAK